MKIIGYFLLAVGIYFSLTSIFGGDSNLLLAMVLLLCGYNLSFSKNPKKLAAIVGMVTVFIGLFLLNKKKNSDTKVDDKSNSPGVASKSKTSLKPTVSFHDPEVSVRSLETFNNEHWTVGWIKVKGGDIVGSQRGTIMIVEGVNNNNSSAPGAGTYSVFWT